MPNPREEPNLTFDKDSVTSNVSRNHKNILLPNIGQFECDGEISLDTITPFTSTGLVECEGIPGQIITEWLRGGVTEAFTSSNEDETNY